MIIFRKISLRFGDLFFQWKYKMDAVKKRNCKWSIEIVTLNLEREWHNYRGAGHFVHILILTCWNPTLCQNVMFFHQNIVGNMKFGYSLIRIDHQTDQNTSNLHKKWDWKVNFSGVHRDKNFCPCCPYFSLVITLDSAKFTL